MSKVISFQVSTKRGGRLRTLQVRVYENVKEMRKAGKAYLELTGMGGDVTDSVGLAQTFELVRYKPNDEEEKRPAVGYIRLSKSHVGSGVIVHEVAHVANAIYRQDVEPQRGPSTETIENEEIFCHIIGDLTSRIINKLYDHGVYE